ncbi:Fc receptor-like protein 5 isoform X2 [Betta splendens]|uniref:Fc receptor-like protein 5 isoform X2 n=1 Tax=Betta splendens TaxID=158456 RepID=A0A6P7MBU5_BETSP|nr:Fc receptor-like protein 5 isoform X2 [Betta splendens]
MKELPTLAFLPFLALTNVFVKTCAAPPVRPVLTGPGMAYLGSTALFSCAAPGASSPLTYDLTLDGVVTRTSRRAERPASFALRVTERSGGSYRCLATGGGGAGASDSVRLTVVTPPSNTRVTSEPSPPVVYEGARVTLSCVVTRGSHLSYTWLFNRSEITSPSSSFNLQGNTLEIAQAAPEQAGLYSCMAWSRIGDVSRFSSSSEILVTVKVYVSKPRISFSVFKEGDGYRGNVTCWSRRGSPPLNFSLSVDDKEVGSVTAAERPAAWFSVAVVPGLDMGDARCQVSTDVQELTSDSVTLEVVPVGGAAKVEVEHLYRADSKLAAIILTCGVSRGTFPYVSWLYNDSVLPAEAHAEPLFQPVLPQYVLADRGRALVLAAPGPRESGYYSCRVRDSYDEAGPWVESPAALVHVTDRILNSMPRATPSPETPQNVHISSLEVITMAFCCFLLLMLAVGVACVYAMLHHRHGVCLPVNVRNSDALPLSAPSRVDTSAERDVQNQNQMVEMSL